MFSARKICTFAFRKPHNGTAYANLAMLLCRQVDNRYFMGQLALLYLFLRAYVLVSIPIDKFENRRHVHVFPRLKGARSKHSVAKIWIESQGNKNVEVYDSILSSKENDLLMRIIDDNWEYINEQMKKSFNGEKTHPKEIKLKK